MKRPLLPFVLAASACATATSPSPSAAPQGTPVSETITGGQKLDAAQHAAKLTGALFEIDRNADQYVLLSATPGADAKEQRDLLGRSLEAQVALYKPELVEAARDASDPQRRRVAAKALAFSRDPDAVPPLVAALDSKDDPTLLVNATYALARIHSPTTPPDKLLALLKDLDPDVRSNALLALWHVFDARRAVGGSPLDAVQQRDAMAYLEPCLFDTADPLIRAHAAAALGALADKRAVDALVDLLRDTHPLVRTQTAIALGKLGDPKALMPLVKMIDASQKGTPRTAVILAAASILEQMGHAPPDNLGEDQRAWERFAKEALAK